MLKRILIGPLKYYCISCLLAAATWAADETTATPQQVPAEQPNDEVFTDDLGDYIPTPVAKKDEAIKVVVSATRGLEQDPLDVPQSISLISQHELDSGSYSTVDDALRKLLPNVGMAQAGQPFTSGQANTTSNYWNQGFSIRGLGGQRVLVMTDSVRQAGNGIGYGGGNLNLYDLYSIEDIEVIKGPASVMYGTDAFGGVVNIITRSPERRTAPGISASIKGGYDGSWNWWRTGGYVDVGNEKGGLVIGGNYVDAGLPSLPHDMLPTGGSYKQYGMYGKFDYYLCERTRARVLANFTEDKDINAVNIGVPLTGIGITPFIIQIPMYRRSELGFEIESLNVTERIEEIKLGIYWQQLRRKSSWTNVTFEPYVVGTKKVSYLDNVFLNTNDTVNTYEFQPLIRLDFEPHKVTLGMDVGLDTAYLPETLNTTFRQSVIPAGPFKVPPQPPTATNRVRADARQWRVGAYVQDNWDLAPFEVVLGGRVDYYDVNNEVNQYSKDNVGLSGSAGLVYHLDEATSLYGNIATGFRVADLSERFQQSVIPFHGMIQVNGNPNLSPERSYSAEIGAKRHEGWVEFEGALFVNQIDDYIGISPVSNFAPPFQNTVAIWQYNNLGGVLLYGAEASAYFLPNDPWQSYVTIGRTYTDNPEKIAEPSWACNFGTLYNFYPKYRGLELVRPELIGRALRPSYDSLNNTNSPGFCTFDAQVTLGMELGSRLVGSVILGCHNILNKVYQEPFFSGAMPGRGFYTSVQVEF